MIFPLLLSLRVQELAHTHKKSLKKTTTSMVCAEGQGLAGEHAGPNAHTEHLLRDSLVL